MPVKSVSWAVGNQTFLSLKDAQVCELEKIFADLEEAVKTSKNTWASSAATMVVNQAEAVIKILSVKESKRKPRSDKGKAHRKPSAEAVNRTLQDGKQ